MSEELTIQPVSRVSLVDSVVEQIRAAIENNALKAGDRLPGELEWARRMGVSRPVVREAVNRLQSVGLVTVERGRGRGMFVGGQNQILNCVQVVRSALSTSPKDMRQFAEFRAALEIHAAGRAAEVASAEQVDELERMAKAIDAPEISDEAAVAADFAFHRKIADIIGNVVIQHTLEVSQEIIELSIRATSQQPRNRARSRKAHAKIVAAIRAHDPNAARKAMCDHMQTVFHYFRVDRDS